MNKEKESTEPNSRDAENIVLGSMINNTNSFNIAANDLDIPDFYYSEHQTIFYVLKGFYKNDKPVETHLLCEELKRIDRLEGVGGVSYVVSLAQYAGTSQYIEEYIEVIKNKSTLRKMIDAAQAIEKSALADPAEVRKTLDDAQEKLFSIGQQANTSPGVLVKDVLSGEKSESGLTYLEKLEARQAKFIEKGKDGVEHTGIPTHFIDLDNLINGLGNSNLIILASRPAMGKTALAMSIAENVCYKNNVPVGIFSLEMSFDQIISRMICSQAQVESQKISNGSISGTEYQKIVFTVKEMKKHTMVIDDQPGLRINDLIARARRLKQSYGIGLLVIDYLQLLTGSSYKSENRQQEVSEISRMLKSLARELNIPILCCSQLSRKVEDRMGHRPMMSDLRDSGSIEQDADVVMFLLRRDYYDPYDKPGQGEVIVGKNRHGQVGSAFLSFQKEYAKFNNLLLSV